MAFGENLQYLRRHSGGMTQEKLAERMGVSRQTVSKWEANEGYPEIPKLLELCDIFGCTLDNLLRGDMWTRDGVFSPVRIVTVEGFRMARYVIISPQPEDDAIGHMRRWAQKCGLADGKQIGWDFPFVSLEQKNRFNLRGYVAAVPLPENFEPECDGVEIAEQPTTDYAVITIREPFAAAFERIPHGYKLIMEHLGAHGWKEGSHEGVVECFEHEYERDGVTYMDVYMHTSSVGKGETRIRLA